MWRCDVISFTLLLRARAEVRARTSGGVTALHLAVQNARGADAARTLLQYQADLNGSTKVGGCNHGGGAPPTDPSPLPPPPSPLTPFLERRPVLGSGECYRPWISV